MEGSYTTKAVLVLFLLLKTVADAIMQAIERCGFGDKPSQQE